MSLCPCGSGRPYEECCETYIEGRETAPTAEALMRSRYAATPSASMITSTKRCIRASVTRPIMKT